MTVPGDEADERLLVEAAQKDLGRFGELYELHFDRVYAFVARRVGNRDGAQDLTAEVFHRAIANLGGYQWRGVPFAAWLLRIAANAVADRWHRDGRERGRPVPDAPGEMGDDDTPERVEERTRLFRLVRGLPADQRRVVLQRFVDQKSIREIARELGRSEGAVKQLQFRALETLRARMSGDDG